MRAIAVCVALCLPLQGCFFLFIPGSVVSQVTDSLSGNSGNMCVNEYTAVGAKIRMPDGRMGTVKKLEGESSRCNGAFKIRAVVDPDVV